MPAASSQVPPPPRLGRYEVLERLGIGGMAEVLLAVRRGPGGFSKAVALKRVLPQLAERTEFIRHMQREAAIAAMMHHPNVVQVNELEEAEGEYFLAMELLYGVSLSQLQKLAYRRGDPFPIGVALRTVSDAARGLHYVHTLEDAVGKNLGIIHRDISPQNLFVTDGGTTKVVDFGIAVAAEVLDSDTRTGVLKGKHPFMSPEQVSFQPIDARTDVWGLGITLWELLTARRLFAGEGFLEVLEAIKTAEVPPPSAVRPDIPLELDVIVLRALTRDREERTQTAGQLADQLDELAKRVPDSGHADVGILVQKYAKGRIKRLKAATSAASGVRRSKAPSYSAPPAAHASESTVEATPSAVARVRAMAELTPSGEVPSPRVVHTDPNADPFGITVTPNSPAEVGRTPSAPLGSAAHGVPSMPSAPFMEATPSVTHSPSRSRATSWLGSTTLRQPRRWIWDAVALLLGAVLGVVIYRLLLM